MKLGRAKFGILILKGIVSVKRFLHTAGARAMDVRYTMQQNCISHTGRSINRTSRFADNMAVKRVTNL